jgi:hypothetical protein
MQKRLSSKIVETSASNPDVNPGAVSPLILRAARPSRHPLVHAYLNGDELPNLEHPTATAPRRQDRRIEKFLRHLKPEVYHSIRDDIPDDQQGHRNQGGTAIDDLLSKKSRRSA